MYNPELQMLRELIWLLLGHCQNGQVTCLFCGRRLLTATGTNSTFGHRRHTKIHTKLTIHHIIEDRDNNDITNLAIVHRKCHRAYHERKRNESSVG